MANYSINSLKLSGDNHIITLPYGVCETAAGTAAKAVTVDTKDSAFELVAGAAVLVKFSNKNSASNPPTLNVNSTGAKPIYRYGTTAASTSDETTGWRAGAVILFIYDGTGWVRAFFENTTYSSLKNPNALTIGNTVYDGSAAKTVTAADLGITGALIFKGTSTTVITDGGTEAPTISGTSITTTNLQAGNVVLYSNKEFVWNGSAWELLGDEGSYALKTKKISAGIGLTGGGTLEADRTIKAKLKSETALSSAAGSGKVYPVAVDKDGYLSVNVPWTDTNTDTNTWRKVQLNGTDKLGNGVSTNPLNIKAGSNMTITESSGTFTFASTNTNDNQTIKANGTAFGINDVVDIIPGANVTISANTDNKSITISAKDTITTDTNTWRRIQLNGTDKLGSGISTNPLNIKAGSNMTISENGGTFTFNATDTNTDTKVTSVGNHYTPAADSAAALSVDASSTTNATWASTSLVTGVNLQRDAKGHVTGVTVDSIRMPSNPNTDTKVTQSAAITTAGNYPLILGYSTATTAVTNTVNKTSTLYYNPSTTLLTSPKYSVNSKVTLEYNATDDSLDFIFV